MEVVEPRTVLIMPIGYEVDGNALDAYASHLLSKPIDEKEERFGTYKEKDLDLHKKFTEPTKKRKVRKEVEELVEQMGISKEVVQRSRDQNMLKEEDMENPKKTKSVSTPPKQSKPRQSQSAPTSGVQKPILLPKPQAKPTGRVEKRKKEKPQREYVEAIAKDIETESDEVVKEVKKIATYARVVRKPQSGGAQSTKKPRTEVEPSGRARANKKQKFELDEDLKSGKVKVDVDQRVDNSGEAKQAPSVIEVVSEKAVEETVDAEKGEDDGKDVSAKVVGKEKGEEKDYQAPVTVARDTLADKGKEVATDSDDFSQGAY
ncbi:uncharacterized protein LOC131874459 [Cryptomeria japonica]|uniref:uncharacterized protein LOC131874459 n=1 Tax=Cryptomeria japonica TaxID=3369 RepID=UPI0027DA1D9D|nr:uncharacterized protein LOC131874459 [Cryptomeria japonica]